MRISLERIICRRFWIRIKLAWPNHQYRVRALHVRNSLRHRAAAYYPTRLDAASGEEEFASFLPVILSGAKNLEFQSARAQANIQRWLKAWPYASHFVAALRRA